jgi:hypothetical protein
MISLFFALLANVAAMPESQAVQASLQSCALENGRYVCRYAVPDILIVPVPGTNIVADAPAAILGSAPSAETESVPPEALVPVPTPAAIAPASPAAPNVTPPATTAEAGPIRPIDAGVLTEREAQLVARCADAGWMSLCLPDDRRAARSLRDKQDAYQAVRRDVARLLGDDQCDAAVKAALDGGYMGLARETRDYCAAPTTASSVNAAATAAPVEDEVETAAKDEPDAETAED